MAPKTVRVTVNADAPDDLTLNGKQMPAGSEVEIERRHLAAVSDYVTVAEPEANEAPTTSAASKTAAPKKKGR